MSILQKKLEGEEKPKWDANEVTYYNDREICHISKACIKPKVSL